MKGKGIYFKGTCAVPNDGQTWNIKTFYDIVLVHTDCCDKNQNNNKKIL
jgi:hypothetical protein